MDSEASLPGLVAVTRSSDVERDLKVGGDVVTIVMKLYLCRKLSKRFKSFQEKLNKMKRTKKCLQSGNMQPW